MGNIGWGYDSGDVVGPNLRLIPARDRQKGLCNGKEKEQQFR
jgi:hypothetical protein